MKKANEIYYGGDYNPEQWDEATLDQDMELFKKAGINLLTLQVFGWSKLEPEEGVYDFAWLDKIIDKIWNHGIYICLATPTTAQPAWLSARYPEVLPVDVQGRKRTHGMRVFFCVNSLKYRERAAAIAGEMAKRYANHPALASWHVANEYGTYCYCENCQAKFRVWLKKRYETIENLNERWHTTFWGRVVYSFEEITLPTELNDDYRFNPTIQLDYMRFVTDSTIECFENEARILRGYNPEIPIMTNMSGFIKKLDQFEMARHLDLVGWDNYPSPSDPPYFIAMKHDIMRGLKGGQSYYLTEQSPNQQNWQPYNKLKRPGEVRMLSYQALAHGADTCLFFQMRQSIAGQEKFHGAVISHSGRDDTRIFREISQIGAEFKKIGSLSLEARTQAKVGILFDWNNWWALELASGPSKDMDYLKMVSHYYESFFKQNIPVDIISMEQDLSKYQMIVAPMLYMMKEGIDEKLSDFVKQGGSLVSTVMTGIADENDRCIYGAYPGPLKDIFGIWVEETDALRPEEENHLEFGENTYSCGFLCDIVRLETAAVLARYQEDFYTGEACITVNSYGKGKAYYIGTQPEQEFLNLFIKKICQEQEIFSLYEAEDGVEITKRISEKAELIYILNHNKKESFVNLGEKIFIDILNNRQVSGKQYLKGMDVLILKKE